MWDEKRKISSLQDLIEAATDANDSIGRQGPVWFRGQSLSKWSLQAKVDRPDYRLAPTTEISMATRFQLQARCRYAKCPDDNDMGSWLPLMAHYGMPTRLLDWTESILVAAYFAVTDTEQSEGDAKIWALQPGLLNKETYGSKRGVFSLADRFPNGAVAAALKLRGKRSVFRAGVPGDRDEMLVIAVHASQVDLRMMMQQGTFTIHRGLTPLNDLPNTAGFLREYIIDGAAKKKGSRLQNELRLAGIRPSSLFPDLGHLANEIEGDYDDEGWKYSADKVKKDGCIQ